MRVTFAQFRAVYRWTKQPALIARELGCTAEQAQKMIDLWTRKAGDAK